MRQGRGAHLRGWPARIEDCRHQLAGLRKEHDAACKVSATYVASSWPDSVPRAILAGGQRIYQLVGAESEFYLAPQGHVIGRLPVELLFTPHVEELLQNNWAVCWHAGVGAAVSCDTFLLTEEGPRAITAVLGAHLEGR